jgi:hypothetical protein
MRTTAVATLALALAACGKTVPLTPDLRASGSAAGDVAALPLRVIGTFELHSGGRTTLVVQNAARAVGAQAPDDSTVVLRVLAGGLDGRSDTLDLKFVSSRAAGGSYTLRTVNGVQIGRSLPIGGQNYQYHPCYQNVGSKCMQPIAEGAREDSEVRVGLHTK